MTHEKIIQRPNGDKVSIEVEIGNVDAGWIVWVMKKKKGDDQFVFVSANAATDEEILSVKMELWEKIKPTL